MNDLVNQVTEGNIPFQSAVLQLSPSQLTMMSLAGQSNYQPLKMARLCRVSLRQLERMFKVESGCTPRQWLRVQRLNKALLLLRKAQSEYISKLQQTAKIERLDRPATPPAMSFPSLKK